MSALGFRKRFTLLPDLVSDPSADASRDSAGKRGQEGFIQIRIQQRNGRKTLTTVQGITEEYDKKIDRARKKVS